MKFVLDWLEHDKEWIFSGIGIPVATGLFFLLRSTLSRKPNALQIKLSFGHLTYDDPPYLSSQKLLFTAGNPGDRPVQLASFSLRLKNGRNVVFPHLDGERRLPCSITPGSSLKFWVELAEIEEIIRGQNYMSPAKVHVVASDALGTTTPAILWNCRWTRNKIA